MSDKETHRVIKDTDGLPIGFEPLNKQVMSKTETKEMEGEWKEGLNQLGFHIEFDEESNSWFASRDHDNIKIIASSEKGETLANEIILSYQALLMGSRSELQHLRTQLKIEIEANEKVRSELQKALISSVIFPLFISIIQFCDRIYMVDYFYCFTL